MCDEVIAVVWHRNTEHIWLQLSVGTAAWHCGSLLKVFPPKPFMCLYFLHICQYALPIIHNLNSIVQNLITKFRNWLELSYDKQNEVSV